MTKPRTLTTSRPQPLRVLFIPDCHHPNVDRDAWRLVLKVAAGYRPDILVTLGDFADFESVSLHEPDEVKFLSLKEEVAATITAAHELVEACGPQLRRKVYIEGNHCTRLTRYLARRAPALWDFLGVDKVLGLTEQGWEFIPYRETFSLGKLHITHDTGKAGRNAHRQSAAAHMGSTIIGHTHRMAYDVNGTFGGVPYLAAMFGWLGDRKKAGSYTHEANAAEWAHGFGTGLLLEDGICHVQPVPIVSGKCVVSGKLYQL